MKEIYKDGLTFKISSKRSDHTFELDSRELNQTLGGAVFWSDPNHQAQMKKPDINMQVEIREEAAYISYETIKGAGGLPVGTSGKGMLMLSGGIDSPVAGYLALKRGVDIEAVHFASPPYTSPGALKKAHDLTRKLTKFGGNIQFIEVPFTEIQEEIKAKAPEAYLMTLTRRFMMRITDRIREVRGGLVIINGESLGQVASQTLESMQAINAVTNTPVIRPVVTMDKLEIIDIAQAIDTFEISIQPFEDCCTIFAPDRPKTNPKLKNAEQYEQRMDVEALVERAVAGIIVTEITPKEEKMRSMTWLRICYKNSCPKWINYTLKVEMKHLAFGVFSIWMSQWEDSFVFSYEPWKQNRKGNGDHPHRTVLYRNKEKDLDRNKRTRSFKILRIK